MSRSLNANSLATTTSLLRIVAVGGAMIALAAATGCSSNAKTDDNANQGGAGAVNPAAESVAVDFYTNGKLNAGCAGTLLSSNIVATAAHCASGATAIRVKAPNANGGQAEVARVMYYDWGLRSTHALEHDLALLVLRSDITASSYAQVDDSTALRAVVTVGGRFVDNNGHAATNVSPVTTVQDSPPAGRTFALGLKSAADGGTAGGAVRRPDGTFVGVYMGKGATTGTGYFTRIDDGPIMGWMTGIVAAKSGVLALAPNAGGTLLAAPKSGVALRNVGGGTGGTGGTTGTGSSSSSGSSGSNDGSGDTSGTPSEDVDSGDTTPDASADGDKAPAALDHGDGTLSDNSKTAVVSKGDNYWAAFEPNDPAAAGDPDAAYAAAHPDLAEVGAHGAPGYMANRPDADTLASMAMGKDGMVVASCFAGAPQADGGPSNAASLAKDSGLDPSNVYGCTDTMGLSATSASCSGTWVDGNGQSLPAATMTKYNLTDQTPCKHRGVTVAPGGGC